MMIATIHAIILIVAVLAKGPIFILSEVNKSKGTTAKLSWSERITWLRTKSSPVPFSPYKIVIINAGITVNPQPLANFNYAEASIPPTGVIDFNNLSFGATQYIWDFGDGSSSTSRAPNHQYEYPGNFDVVLTAINEFGCIDTMHMRITVDFFFGLFIPNAFTPGSGADIIREFLPAGIGLKEYHIEVFNAWGTKLWESNLIDDRGHPVEAWDGTYQGVPCKQDVYVWKVFAVFEGGLVWKGMVTNGGRPSTTGTVTLIR